MTKPISKPCPACGGTLVERSNRDNGSRFLGCQNWPVRQDEATGAQIGCAHTEPIPTYYRMIEQGAEQLPGFSD